MKIPYKEAPNAKGEVCYYAALNVYIALPGEHAPRSKRIEAIVDSGAARTIFYASIGRALGFEIENGELEEPIGITGQTSKTYLHDIARYAPGGVIQTRAGFSNELPVAGILGMKGFFDHFRITFDPADRHIELERIYQA